MGRPRKPTQVLEISGALRKNPQRRRARAVELAVPSGLGPPPAEWTEGAKASQRFIELLRTWAQIEAQDVLGVLNRSHWLLVKNTCQLQYKIDRACAGFGKATSGDYAQVKSNLAAMGQTPIDSSRVAEAVRVPDRGGAHSQRPGSSWGEYVGLGKL